MTLHGEQFVEKIQELLVEKGVLPPRGKPPRPCSACGQLSKKTILRPALIPNAKEFRYPPGKEVDTKKEAFFFVAIKCDNCGNVQFYSPEVLGLPLS